MTAGKPDRLRCGDGFGRIVCETLLGERDAILGHDGLRGVLGKGGGRGLLRIVLGSAHGSQSLVETRALDKTPWTRNNLCIPSKNLVI